VEASRAAGLVLKRAIDIIVSASALLLLLPLLLIVALLVRFRLGAPVLFRQQRPGRDARIFRLVKFRTMTDERGPDGELLDDEIRLGTFGQWLRSTSLDELPSLWNVLMGDMSLVGPRPLLIEYLPLYDDRQAMRHDMRPGITGLAQISGRNDTDWGTRLELDVQYVENWSLTLDAGIALKTLGAVLRREGVSARGHPTMPRFTGRTQPGDTYD
jgi:lipopolysaccharide/colanic/teichoic acid biosynthesis glycosyltransferase